MSITETRNGSWPAGIDAGFERLITGQVRGDAERARLKRLVGVLLASPFVVAPAVLPAFASFVSGPILMAAACAVFALTWIGAAIVAATGNRTFAEPIALFCGVVAVSVAIAGSGGMATPAALLAAALVFEPWWISSSRMRAAGGTVAACAAFALSAAVSPHLIQSWLSMSVWGWLAPCLYIALTIPRLTIADRRDRVEDGKMLGLDAKFDAPVISLSCSGEIIDATNAAGKLFGLTGGLLVGRSLFERVHVADRIALVNALADIKAGRCDVATELKIRVRDDRLPDAGECFVPVALDLLHVSRADRQITLQVRDTAEVMRLRDELREARDAADSIEITKSRFLAAVSHELRTPLNAIIGFSDMMLNDLAGSLADRQREYVGMISQSGHHLLSVVNAILDVSRIEAGTYGIRPEPFVVNEAVELCGSMMTHQATAQDLELSVTVRPGVREMTADRRAVQQIIINLLTNAIKFTPAGGAVSLDVFRQDGAVHFVVADNGIGIASDDLSKLGQPFTQLSNDVSRQFEGAGLGLSLVKGLVALHDGKLEISSALGKGTEVRVELPLEGPQQNCQNADVAEPAGAVVEVPRLRFEDEKIRKTA